MLGMGGELLGDKGCSIFLFSSDRSSVKNSLSAYSFCGNLLFFFNFWKTFFWFPFLKNSDKLNNPYYHLVTFLDRSQKASWGFLPYIFSLCVLPGVFSLISICFTISFVMVSNVGIIFTWGQWLAYHCSTLIAVMVWPNKWTNNYQTLLINLMRINITS